MTRTGGDGATKIVATIADNAERPGALRALLAAGVDVVRLNGAHAKPGDIARRTALVRRVAAGSEGPSASCSTSGGRRSGSARSRAARCRSRTAAGSSSHPERRRTADGRASCGSP